ncbi:hypothetical protein HPP92_020722 [Vanilla planifolia]|uniref:Plant heme peroxidase family profile domain-containing protein n=1 Tax=Vanilla planifolia TaxID=51239 RepID=A0A835PXE4_VANPL|nr:hypothetical protein HPP92_020722 [Vanilla planifolia]
MAVGSPFFSILCFPSPSKSCLPSATLSRANVTISCHQKLEECKNNEGMQRLQLNRRDVLRCFTSVVGLEMIVGSELHTETAFAADLIQRRQRYEFQTIVKDTLSKALKQHLELIPSILTLALNDAATYDKATNTGGPNGSIRLRMEISRPENRGLSAALDLLVEAKKEIDSYSKGGLISYADLIQFAAQAAVKKTFLASAIRKCGWE